MNEIREVFSPLWNIQLWTSLQKRRLELELHQNPQYHINWEVFQTKKNLTNALSLLDSASCPSLSQKVSHFLSCYDADLREDPVSAIDNAHTLLSEVQNTFEEKKVEWTDLSPSPSSLFFSHLLTPLICSCTVMTSVISDCIDPTIFIDLKGCNTAYMRTVVKVGIQ